MDGTGVGLTGGEGIGQRLSTGLDGSLTGGPSVVACHAFQRRAFASS